MGRRLVSSRVLQWLVAGVIVLPIAICVILAVTALLGQMGEPPQASPLKWVALGVAIVWVIDLVCLVLAQGLNALGERDEEP